ncbi:PhnA domain-containing protein [Pedobacter sp. SL55]|uniref:PhnA domain-containing protein n=1 Tax=Pedobacter sp. SL55 TaxID=2995161 RepID=UPI0022707283|nr:alkylphosphonate utilization protein [Pedobacter sp. SL55]WAC40866.1 PhnA domain-containing protein [Pedobacter sp. SL55]
MLEKLKERSGGLCELCSKTEATNAYVVSPKKDDAIENQVALCNDCLQNIEATDQSFYWRVVEGSIWNPEQSVQALSYRILQNYKDEDWASGVLSMVDLDEDVIQWGMSGLEIAAVHTDAFGNVLEHGDTVVLTQALDVKGTNFSAPKGTVVKKIRLVHDNHEQIEGKINEQMIVILTKYVKKNN